MTLAERIESTNRQASNLQTEIGSILGAMISKQQTTESVLRSLIEDGVSCLAMAEQYGAGLEQRYLYACELCAKSAEYDSEALEVLTEKFRDSVYRCLVIIGR